MSYDKVHQALRGADHEAMMEAIEEEADKAQQRNKDVARGWPGRCGYYESIIQTLTFELAWERRKNQDR